MFSNYTDSTDSADDALAFYFIFFVGVYQASLIAMS